MQFKIIIGFIKKMFIELLSPHATESCNSKVCLNNQPCWVSPALDKINSDERLCCPFTFNVNKVGGSCNTLDDLCARVCVPDKVKNMKKMYLIIRVNETRF